MFQEHRIEITPAKHLLIQEKTWNDELCIDLRFWVKWRDDSDWVPTKKGLLIPRDMVKTRLLPALLQLLED